MKTNPLESLEQALGYEFKDQKLITEALTHRSHHHELGDSPHNERLEFLGDAVLDLCITEIIMELSPDRNEGQLSKIRSQLVSQSGLALIAEKIKVGQYIRLGKGEESSGGRTRVSLLADALEAIIAALYQDSGSLSLVKQCIQKLWELDEEHSPLWNKASKVLLKLDFKSRLQEFCQSVGLGAPHYVCRSSTGPDHCRRFSMAILIGGRELARAEAGTKKEATSQAARALWELFDGDLKVLKHLIQKAGETAELTETQDHADI